MPSYESLQVRQSVLFTDGTLIAAAANVQSPWINVASKKVVYLTKVHTTGTYGIIVEWGRDGSTVDFTHPSISLVDNTPTALTVTGPYVRFRITCTTTQFTVHRTTVFG